MLEKLDKFCSELKARIVIEQADDKFEDAAAMVEALNEKLSFDDFKHDRELIKKIKRTFKDIRDEALEKYYDESLNDEEQDQVKNQIYHYAKEF